MAAPSPWRYSSTALVPDVVARRHQLLLRGVGLHLQRERVEPEAVDRGLRRGQPVVGGGEARA